MSAGIVVGGAAAVVFASTKRKDVIAWLSKGAKEPVDEPESEGDEIVEQSAGKKQAGKKEKVWAAGESEGDNHKPGVSDAIL
jgi:hypothetical protein